MTSVGQGLSTAISADVLGEMGDAGRSESITAEVEGRGGTDASVIAEGWRRRKKRSCSQRRLVQRAQRSADSKGQRRADWWCRLRSHNNGDRRATRPGYEADTTSRSTGVTMRPTSSFTRPVLATKVVFRTLVSGVPQGVLQNRLGTKSGVCEL